MILITGANGHIGTAIIDFLRTNNADMAEALANDLTGPGKHAGKRV